MKLRDLGFDGWFEKHQSEISLPQTQAARVTAVDRDRYVVRDSSRSVPAELSGKLLYYRIKFGCALRRRLGFSSILRCRHSRNYL